jgi:formiminotetrahydrofolate cyclodeaminase
LSLADILAGLADLDPQPAAGPAAAIAATLAAGLAELTARLSGETELAERARALRTQVAPLAQADADAYAAYLRDPADAAVRDRTIALPAQLGELAAEIAEVAAQASERGKPKLRGDAAAGALLAEAAARAAANLVAINSPGSYERIGRARAAAGAASEAADRAVAAL